ncbi:kinetochore protein ndc80 [Endocarpon pusillum Z07020]|uniref:Kinetochore protein NDC80 n=1 Tax=Endocarpon pusillum (strain Z07020 / HMAS-L-300199) TaxID=1263415 RepID=U1HWR2_ENDPU|nr:kinetochore protein ndc80 [Endocarpon pusillum Z07020]ERF75210.1 kinetochore protein ndc80 [Endocarpon pusillum Z07020]
MAQPSGLFSVRRPRETLGNLQNFSGIPQPASAVKRSSSSTDLRNAPFTAQHARSTSVNPAMGRPPQPNFQRSSSGSNLADMGMSTARRSVSNNPFASSSTHRQSLAPSAMFTQQTPASTSIQRRSSIYSRPSNGGPISHQSFFTQPPPPAGKPEDPRPLKSRVYQDKISQELLEYLTHNNFEMEMKHSLTERSLKSPTQKDFNQIFQWLYRRLDPGYRFQKGMDAEVPPILKQLRYPYEKNISKSQITAVGGQNWSAFLGLLHWMMQLAQMMDRYNSGSYDQACAEAGVDVSGDRIVSRFLFHAYQDWLQVGPDDDDNAEDALIPHVQAMTAEFERSNAKFAEELEMYEAENKALKAQIEEVEKSAPDIAKLDKHFKILEDDKRKFEDYNSNVQSKIEKYESRIKILDSEIEKTDIELNTAEAERSELQQAVDKQGLNIQDIDRMNTERERLQKSLDDIQAALDEINRRVLEKEMETAGKLEDLEAAIKRYNSLGYQLGLIPSTAPNAKGQSYELSLNLPDTNNLTQAFSSSLSNSTSTSHRRHHTPETDRLLADTNLGHSASTLLHPHPSLRPTIRPALLSLRKEISSRRKHLHSSTLTHLDLLTSLSDALSEKNREIDTLTHAVRLAEHAYHAQYDMAATQHTQYTASTEKLEAELVRMRRGIDEGALRLEQREMETQLLWEAMQGDVGRVREGLHRGVEAVLEEVVRFKVRVQRGLEEFEGWVGGEVEGELLEEEEAGLGIAA